MNKLDLSDFGGLWVFNHELTENCLWFIFLRKAKSFEGFFFSPNFEKSFSKSVLESVGIGCKASEETLVQRHRHSIRRPSFIFLLCIEIKYLNISLRYLKHALDTLWSWPDSSVSPGFAQLYCPNWAVYCIYSCRDRVLARKILFGLQWTHMFKILQSKPASKHTEVRVKHSYTSFEVFSGRRRKADESNGYFQLLCTFQAQHNCDQKKEIIAKSSPLIGGYCNQLSGAFTFVSKSENELDYEANMRVST